MTHLVDTLVYRHELGRRLLHTLVANPDQVLLVPSVKLLRRDEVAELGIVLDHLVLDVKTA